MQPPRSELSSHPCFNHAARLTHARVHLPVAPKCNMRCNYCNRKFNCSNESRPGVTCRVISPEGALRFLGEVVAATSSLSVVGIAGPGDPFANPEETMETLRLVRKRYPGLMLCLATNGLNLFPYIPALAELAVSHVTITVNAVDPAIGASTHAWITDGGVRLQGIQAASLLWERQQRSILALKAYGIVVKINTILMLGVNDRHVVEVAGTVAGIGADLFNLMPLYPVPGTPFASLPEPRPDQVRQLRDQAGRFLPQMRHCRRCRADAVGMLGGSGCEMNLLGFGKETTSALRA